MKLLLKMLPTSVIHKVNLLKAQNYESFKNYFLKQDAETLELLREKYLIHTFKRNAQRIPQYTQFLKKNKIDFSVIKTKNDFLTKVPDTNKKNYIFSAKELSDLCLDGDYRNVNMIVKSSGHSGRQCYWAKSHKEDLFGKNALSISLEENFDIKNTKTLIINGFILGSWVTGVTFNEFASAHCTVINVGPNKEEIFQIMQDIGAQFKQILITGYPPFIKELIDYGTEIKFPFKSQVIHFAVGGEDFPETWRDYVIANVGPKTKIRSGFGASDIGILGGVETEDTIYLRRMTGKNSKLKKALFGEVEDTPMIFQYSLNIFVHTNSQRELVFTTILPESVEPVIKYNLEDIGGVITQKEMKTILQQFNIKREFKLPLPFMYVVGRVSGPIKFHAFLIYPENVQDCIYHTKNVSSMLTGNFKLKTVVTSEHEHVLQIELQMKKGLKQSTKLKEEFTTEFTTGLQRVNDGYKAVYNRIGQKAVPKIVLYSFEDYPYKSKIKNVYS